MHIDFSNRSLVIEREKKREKERERKVNQCENNKVLGEQKIASKIKSYPSLAKYEKLNKIINFLFVNSERIDLIIMLFFLILFLLIKIMDIYLLVMVKDHLDELIWVYNDINKK